MENRIKTFIDNILKQIERVKREDAFLLLPPRVYEPAISHKLAEYIQSIFPKYNVDVEYDKYGSDARKELENFRDVCPENSTDGIRPDIIVHQRGIRLGNLMVIEIKDCNAPQTSRNCVEEKLKRLTKRDGQFGYLIGLLWLFGPDDEEEIFFYINGIKYNANNIEQIIDILKIDYEIPVKEHYFSFLRLKKTLRENWKKAVEIYEEDERKEADQKMEKEIEDRMYYDSLDYDNKYLDFLDNMEEDRISNMDIDDQYQETGILKGWDIEPADEFHQSSLNQESEEEDEDSDEDIDGNGDMEQNYRPSKHEYIQRAINKYKQGLLYSKGFSYPKEENDNESRKIWLNAWKDLHYLSTNSILFYFPWCIREQKEFLEMASEYSLLSIFNDNDERTLAREHLEFLTGWLGYQEETLKRK
jgi:hypothetical protein